MLVRIVAYVWIVNLAVLILTSLLAAQLGTDKPDATHSYMVHWRGYGDLFYSPTLGMYMRRVGPGIFLGGWAVGLLYAWLSNLKSQSGPKNL